jgi:hypothetical protein
MHQRMLQASKKELSKRAQRCAISAAANGPFWLRTDLDQQNCSRCEVFVVLQQVQSLVPPERRNLVQSCDSTSSKWALVGGTCESSHVDLNKLEFSWR